MKANVSARQVEAFTRKKVTRLLQQAKENTKALAELRRGIGKVPGEIPQLWGYYLESMPEDFYGNTEPSRAEWAVYAALTLFALHQQGKDPQIDPMQKEGQSFGKALSYLVHSQDDQERILRRFNIIATASSVEELFHYMRSAVQLLRAENIGLDYAKLAGDIYCYQFPELISTVRLRWGQDFYRNKSDESIDIS